MRRWLLPGATKAHRKHFHGDASRFACGGGFCRVSAPQAHKQSTTVSQALTFKHARSQGPPVLQAAEAARGTLQLWSPNIFLSHTLSELALVLFARAFLGSLSPAAFPSRRRGGPQHQRGFSPSAPCIVPTICGVAWLPKPRTPSIRNTALRRRRLAQGCGHPRFPKPSVWQRVSPGNLHAFFCWRRRWRGRWRSRPCIAICLGPSFPRCG